MQREVIKDYKVYLTEEMMHSLEKAFGSLDCKTKEEQAVWCELYEKHSVSPKFIAIKALSLYDKIEVIRLSHERNIEWTYKERVPVYLGSYAKSNSMRSLCTRLNIPYQNLLRMFIEKQGDIDKVLYHIKGEEFCVSKGIIGVDKLKELRGVTDITRERVQAKEVKPTAPTNPNEIRVSNGRGALPFEKLEAKNSQKTYEFDNQIFHGITSLSKRLGVSAELLKSHAAGSDKHLKAKLDQYLENKVYVDGVFVYTKASFVRRLRSKKLSERLATEIWTTIQNKTSKRTKEQELAREMKFVSVVQAVFGLEGREWSWLYLSLSLHLSINVIREELKRGGTVKSIHQNLMALSAKATPKKPKENQTTELEEDAVEYQVYN